MTDYSTLWASEIGSGQRVALDIDYGFTVSRNCSNCADTRRVYSYRPTGAPSSNHPGGHAKWFDNYKGTGVSGWVPGGMESEPCPVCAGEDRAVWLRDNCGLAGTDLLKTLSTFRTSGITAPKTAALNACRALLGMGAKPAGFVTLTGGYGVGKTHLLTGIVNGFRAVGVYARYTTTAEILDDIKAHFGDRATTAQEIAEQYRTIRVLCIDEFDRVSLTAWAKQSMFQLVDGRYRGSENLLTVFAMNAEVEELPAELGYVASRMRSGQIINVPGPEMREIA